ncbi:50S ribosomal protein L4 [Nocardioides sp. J2M5]|nr:50S ribosomal protein L4 [Nocardioides palaemonis]
MPEGGVKLLDVTWPPAVRETEPNVPLMHQVVTAQLAAARQGTHSTRTRGEVRGGGRKPYKQKGTGRARQGSTRAPQFTGGGVVHGPKPRSYGQRTPKKMKRGALLGALSDRLQSDRLVVISGFGLERPSTKRARLLLESIADDKGTQFLVALSRDELHEQLSLRNLRSMVHVNFVDQLNTLDVLNADYVVFTKAAFHQFADPTVDTAEQNGASSGAVPTGKASELLEKGHEDGKVSPINLDLSAAIEVASTMSDIETYVRDGQQRHAASFAAAEMDAIAVEQHDGFVLISWPTALRAADALTLLRGHAQAERNTSDVTLYAGSDDRSIEHEDGDPIEWQELYAIGDQLHYVRLELADRTLVWSKPDGPYENENRFASLAPSIGSDDLFALFAETKAKRVSKVMRSVLGSSSWVMNGLPELV